MKVFSRLIIPHTGGIANPRAGRWRLWCLLLVIVAYLPACSMFDDDEEEIDTEPAELVKFTPEVKLKRVWSASIGNGQGEQFNRLELAVSGDTIYAAEVDGRVYALNRLDGDKIWVAKTGKDLTGGVGLGGGLLILGTAAGEVVALDQANGRELWTAKVSGEVLSSPAANDDFVVVHSFDGSLYGLDARTGERRWQYDSKLPVLTVRGNASPMIIDSVVYAAFANGRLNAFSVEDGKILWEGRVAISKGQSEIERVVDVDGNPHVVGSNIFAVSYQGRVTGFDLRGGKQVWFREASSNAGLSDGFGNLYYSNSAGSVVALDLNNGNPRWQQDELARRQLSAPQTFNNYVAVGDFEGYIHLLSQDDGHMAGREHLGSDGIRAPMVRVGDLLYVYGNGGKLVAYTIRK